MMTEYRHNAGLEDLQDDQTIEHAECDDCGKEWPIEELTYIRPMTVKECFNPVKYNSCPDCKGELL